MGHRLFTEDECFMVECDGLITHQYEVGNEDGLGGTVHCLECKEPLIDWTSDTGQHEHYQWQVTKVYPHVDASVYKQRKQHE